MITVIIISVLVFLILMYGAKNKFGNFVYNINLTIMAVVVSIGFGFLFTYIISFFVHIFWLTGNEDKKYEDVKFAVYRLHEFETYYNGNSDLVKFSYYDEKNTLRTIITYYKPFLGTSSIDTFVNNCYAKGKRRVELTYKKFKLNKIEKMFLFNLGKDKVIYDIYDH